MLAISTLYVLQDIADMVHIILTILRAGPMAMIHLQRVVEQDVPVVIFPKIIRYLKSCNVVQLFDDIVSLSIAPDINLFDPEVNDDTLTIAVDVLFNN